jgi:hypothetical protein
MSQLKKLERDQKFNADEFNKKFEEADSAIEEEQDQVKKEIPQQISQETSENLSYTQDLGINIKNLFFEILEMLMNRENPIPYIMESEKRQFHFAVMILIIGGLLLFWSNLMINETKST